MTWMVWTGPWLLRDRDSRKPTHPKWVPSVMIKYRPKLGYLRYLGRLIWSSQASLWSQDQIPLHGPRCCALTWNDGAILTGYDLVRANVAWNSPVYILPSSYFLPTEQVWIHMRHKCAILNPARCPHRLMGVRCDCIALFTAAG